ALVADEHGYVALGAQLRVAIGTRLDLARGHARGDQRVTHRVHAPIARAVERDAVGGVVPHVGGDLRRLVAVHVADIVTRDGEVVRAIQTPARRRYACAGERTLRARHADHALRT